MCFSSMIVRVCQCALGIMCSFENQYTKKVASSVKVKYPPKKQNYRGKCVYLTACVRLTMHVCPYLPLTIASTVCNISAINMFPLTEYTRELWDKSEIE